MAEPREDVESVHEFPPGAALMFEGAAAFGSEAIEAAAALAGFFDPAAFYQALAFQAVEQRVERSHVKLELVVGLGFDELGELIAVACTSFEKRKNDHLGATLLELANISGCHIC